MTSPFIFCCYECGVGIVKDSKEHDNCVCDRDGEKWWCVDCGNNNSVVFKCGCCDEITATSDGNTHYDYGWVCDGCMDDLESDDE